MPPRSPPSDGADGAEGVHAAPLQTSASPVVGTFAETERFQPRRALIVEGILIFTDPSLRAQMDIKVFVDTDSDTRFIRRLQRDVAERARTMDSVIDQYQSTVKPMHLEFVEPSKRYADVLIPLGGHNTVAVDLLLTMLRSVAARRD